jgi:hypothetical protein
MKFKFRVSLSTVVLAVMLLAYLGSLIPSKKEGFSRIDNNNIEQLQFTGVESIGSSLGN